MAVENMKKIEVKLLLNEDVLKDMAHVYQNVKDKLKRLVKGFERGYNHPVYGKEHHTIWTLFLPIPYDAETGQYRLIYPTEGREPGIYDLWISFGDGQHQRIRIALLPMEVGWLFIWVATIE